MKKAFTIIELLLAVSLMAILLIVSGAVFRMAVTSYRTAAATGEVSRKLRAVTDQINRDFKGLRKDAQIFVAWVPANPYDSTGDGIFDSYQRFDRITFFANGDFYSYNDQPAIRGNVARITYMLANSDLVRPGTNMLQRQQLQAQAQNAADRVLARSQHIYTAESALVDLDPTDPAQCRIRWIDPGNIRGLPLLLGQDDWTGAFTQANDNFYEYDNLTLGEWLTLPWVDLRHMLTVISDIRLILPPVPPGGVVVNARAKPPVNVHQLLAEGVGSFTIQGWYEPLDPAQGPARWFPQVDPDRDGDLSDTDFHLAAAVPPQIETALPLRLIYPWPWDLDPVAYASVVDLGQTTINNYPRHMIDRPNFNHIPGLGRALKFTFTLYDSRGVFKDGKTFTHIVYLDD